MWRRSVDTEDKTEVTVFVPAEEECGTETGYEQSREMQLCTQEMKNPNVDDVKGLLKMIIDGPPGNEVDRQMLDPNNKVAIEMGVGQIMELPANFSEADFSIKGECMQLGFLPAAGNEKLIKVEELEAVGVLKQFHQT